MQSEEEKRARVSLISHNVSLVSIHRNIVSSWFRSSSLESLSKWIIGATALRNTLIRFSADIKRKASLDSLLHLELRNYILLLEVK